MTYSLHARHRMRGQTIPFWVFTTLTVLALVFFVMNYANTLRWQVRAQNAADSSAIAKISGDAAVLNSSTMLLYALNLENIKTQTLLSSALTLLGGNTSCGTLGLGGQCGVGSLITVATKTLSNAQDLSTIALQLPSAISQITSLAANPTGLANSLAGQGCVKLSTDCSFTYTTTVNTTSLVPPTVKIDEITCKKVSQFAAGFLKVGGTYYAIGHASVTLTPLGNIINPATTSNGGAGPPDLNLNPLFPNVPQLQILNANVLSVNLGILVPQQVPATPISNLTAIEQSCA